MITQEQNREYNRSSKLEQYLAKDQSKSVYAGYEPFNDEATDFDGNFESLTQLIPDKNHVTTGITTDKRGFKQRISDELGLVCRKTYSYALKYNNSELAAQVNTRADLIFKMRDADLLGYAQGIEEIITPLLNDANYIKYGVTAKQLGDIVADATTFNSMIGEADVTGSENTVANTAIDKVIDKLRLNIKHMDLLVDEFAESNPEFVQGYHLNSEVDKTGIRHSGIEGYVRTKEGEPVANATVKLQGTTKTAVTDLKGYYHIDRAHPDDYMVECSAEGYATQTKLHHISLGKTDEMDWELQAV